MKEIYIKTIDHDFNGDDDPQIQALAKQSCEEFNYIEDHMYYKVSTFKDYYLEFYKD